MKKHFIAAIIFLTLSPLQAQADIWVDTIRLSCSPRMDYFSIENINIELTNDTIQNSSHKGEFYKDGFVFGNDIKNYECQMRDGTLIELEIKNYPAAISCGGSERAGTDVKLWISKHGKKKLIFDDIFTWECRYGRGQFSQISYQSGKVTLDYSGYGEQLWLTDIMKGEEGAELPIKNEYMDKKVAAILQNQEQEF